jgi:hypothetical protein
MTLIVITNDVNSRHLPLGNQESKDSINARVWFSLNDRTGMGFRSLANSDE